VNPVQATEGDSSLSAPAPAPAPTAAPRLSIIIAVFNNARDLPRCLASVAGQSFTSRELIVIDGGSTDGTLDIIHENVGRIAYFESGPDGGVYDAWNKALPHARGEWICFLGSDDRFHDDGVLARMVPLIASARPEYGLVYGRLNIVAGDGRLLETVVRPWPELKTGFLAGTAMLPHTGAFHHRSLFDIHGGFDPSFRIAGDYDFLLRALESAGALYIDGEVVVDMSAGGMSSSPQNMYLRRREIARARAKNGITSFSPLLTLRRLMALTGLAVMRVFGRRALSSLLEAYRYARRHVGGSHS
jgi:glycosyltransferase involved in cell wall biosynthesis